MKLMIWNEALARASSYSDFVPYGANNTSDIHSVFISDYPIQLFYSVTHICPESFVRVGEILSVSNIKTLEDIFRRCFSKMFFKDAFLRRFLKTFFEDIFKDV